MITDKQRREVAQKLRDIKRVDLGDGLVCLSCDLGEVLGFDWADDYHIFEFSVDLLADLIDRPTCRNVGDDYMFKCSECGAEFEPVTVNGNEYGEVFYTPLKPLYCSACGAEVVE